jgi:hypothetical protein
MSATSTTLHCQCAGIGSGGTRAFSRDRRADCYVSRGLIPRALHRVGNIADCSAVPLAYSPRDGQACSGARMRQPRPAGCKARNFSRGVVGVLAHATEHKTQKETEAK